MRKLQWISLTVVAVLVVVLILARNCLREESARYEVMQLLRIAFPPQSVCMSEPYFSGGGNNAKICVSASITCVVGSSLSRPEIQDYYTQRLGSKWKIIDERESGAFSWQRSGLVLDKMVAIEYEPKYLPADSKPGKDFQEARQSRATAYVLTIMANKCTGPFP